jgi:competence protein ComEA
VIRAAATAALLVGLLTSTSAARADMSHAQAAPASATTSTVAAKTAEGVVNLNAASEDELGFLPGVGPSKAKAIIEHRRTHPFHKVDELTKVKGIGKKTLGRLRPYLTVAGPTTLTQEVKMHR